MFELDFAKEPFDSKLFVLRYLRKIWIVVAGAFIGAVLIGGGNYLKKVTFGGPTLYEIETTYYVDYYTDPTTGMVNVYINQATWENWITTDWFQDRIWAHVLELGLPAGAVVTKDTLQDYVSATLETDWHIPVTYVQEETEAVTKMLNEAVKLAMGDFAERQEEILGIEVINETSVHVKDRDDRTLRACILGAVLGAFVSGLLLALYIVADSTVYVPETFAYRYGIQVLGTLCKGEEELSAEAKANLSHKFEKAKKKTVLPVGGNVEVPRAVLAEGFAVVRQEELPDAYETLRESDGVLLFVEAGKNSGKSIEHTLHELKVQDCPVKGALLCGADAGLLKAYYFGRYR